MTSFSYKRIKVFLNFYQNKIVFLLITFFSMLPIFWFHEKRYIYGHDMMSIIGENNYYGALYLWNDSLHGGLIFSTDVAYIIYYLYFKVFSILHINLHYSEMILFVSVIFMGISGMYLYLLEIFKRKYTNTDMKIKLFIFTTSLFYTYSFYSLERWHELQFTQLVIFYGCPLLIFSAIKLTDNIYSFIYNLFFLVTAVMVIPVSFSNPADIVSILIAYSIITIIIIGKTIKWKNIFLPLSIIVTIILPFIVATYYFSQYTKETNFSSQTSSSFENIINEKNTLLNILRFTNSYPRNLVIIEDGKSNLYSWGPYYNNQIIILLNYFFIILFIFATTFLFRKNKYVIFLKILLVFDIFLLKGANKPLGTINFFLYDKVPFFWIFRSPDLRFTPLLILILSLLLIFLYQNSNSKKIRLLIFVTTVMYIIIFPFYPIFTNKVIEKQRGIIPSLNTTISDDYKNLSNVLNFDKSTNKVLYLPTYYWYLSGPNMSYTGWPFINQIINKTLFYHSNGTLIPSRTEAIVDNIFSGNFSLENMQKLNIKYIIYDHNAEINKIFAPKDELENIYKNLYLFAEKYGYKVRSFGQLELIEIPEPSSVLNFKINPINDGKGLLKNDYNIIYSHVSPTRYDLNLNLPKDANFSITLLNNYNSNWDIYFLPKTFKTKTYKCEYGFRYYEGNTVECLTKKIFPDFYNLFFLKHVDIARHEVASNGYSNSWYIDQSSSSHSPDKSSYSEDTTNLQIVLYFKPQLYFYLSITVGIILILLIYIILFFLRVKNKLKASK